ncbi:uncharacterized protein LOC105277013 isoform X2 [Ooceraea biroi]|uniref:uncharacterized protein LOC105277013 isoform X2 n=1 Tax=Ooceraea biroi TaxID=2015173 RepID=UPI0005BA7879|nr:uncharacterized protein LOC105277013 isoform X2 [Ooceraea biroi]
MKNKMLPKKSCTKQAAFAKQILNLSNSSFKGIPRNGTSKRFSVDKVQSIARQSIDTESSFIMKYESGVDGSQNKSFAILDDIWTSNTTMDHNNRYKFNDDNHVKTKINSRNNRLKLHASENRVDTSKFHDGKFRRKEKLEKLSSTTVKSFKQNLSERMASNDTIYLYENQISKCVIK